MSSNLKSNNLTPEQLIQLMETSAKQYTSIDAKLKATAYQQEEGSSQQIVQHVYEITSRWTQDKKYWKISMTMRFPGYTTNDKLEMRKEVRTYAFNSQRTKRLIEVPGRVPRGLIRPGGVTDLDQSFYTIYSILWEFCERLWKKKSKLNDVNLEYDKISNLYELQVLMGSPKGPIYKFYVDPTKNFIPIKRDVLKNDGTLVHHLECDKFEKINDVWIPREFFCTCPYPQGRLTERYEVEQVSVNVPIDDKLLDFDFPEGTIVRDRR